MTLFLHHLICCGAMSMTQSWILLPKYVASWELSGSPSIRQHGRRTLSQPDTIAEMQYDGPYAAELSLALEIAAEAGKMITSASSKRWTHSAAPEAGQEPGTKKNSVDVSSSAWQYSGAGSPHSAGRDTDGPA